jgi:hypothetical protein
MSSAAADGVRYANGDVIAVGDNIGHGGRPGVVVCVVAPGGYTDGFPEASWSYLADGFLAEVDGLVLVHFLSADEDTRLVKRAAGR